jgi:acid stress chaperone HdeB
MSRLSVIFATAPESCQQTRENACGARDPFDGGCTRVYSGCAGTLDLETLMRVASAVLDAIVLLLPDPASAQVVDLSTIKCKEFLDSSKATIGYIMMWLDGYFTGEDDPAVVDFDQMKQKGERLGEYCAMNPSHGLLTAAEEVMEK